MIKLIQKIMKAILNFIDAWGVRIMFLLVIIIFFKTCTTNTKVQNVNDSVDSLSVKLRKEIKIEGLKSEKRAIQASDRKILDVNRQTQIDQEIKQISND
jgi:thioredoxin-related protein